MCKLILLVVVCGQQQALVDLPWTCWVSFLWPNSMSFIKCGCIGSHYQKFRTIVGLWSAALYLAVLEWVSTFLFRWLAEQSARWSQYKTQLNTHSKLVLNVFWEHQCCQLPPLYKLRSFSHSGNVVIAVGEAIVYKKYRFNYSYR